MSKYDVNFKRLALLLLPTFWRKPLFAAVVYSLVAPFNILYVRFQTFRRQSLYRLTHNGQVCYLRAVLNDTFDPLERRLTITDISEGGTYWMLYKREMENSASLPKRETQWAVMITSRKSGDDKKYDFWINVPGILSKEIDPNYLKAIVNQYKLASKRFSINYR